MYIPPNISKQPLGPAATIILAIVFLAVTSLLFYLVFDGFQAGEIVKLSKYSPAVIIRKDSPDQFFHVVVVYLVLILLNATMSVLFFVSSYRKLRR
jgi:hypothetical protein